MSRCRRTLRRVAGCAQGHRWVSLAAYCGSKVRSFGQWTAANCAALPTVSAGENATSRCKPLLFWFPGKRRYSKCPDLWPTTRESFASIIDFAGRRYNSADATAQPVIFVSTVFFVKVCRISTMHEAGLPPARRLGGAESVFQSIMEMRERPTERHTMTALMHANTGSRMSSFR